MAPGEREAVVARVLDLAPAGFAEEDGRLVVHGEADAIEAVRRAFPEAEVAPVPTGWEDEWRRFHVPVAVGPLWIGPPWEEAPAGLTAVVVDPGRAFGTGAHETTRLCLELLLECERGSFLDVGCGSGVLAIAAARLGFAPVIAVDVEQNALDAAARNARANSVELELRLLDARTAVLPGCDVAAANVTLETVEAVAQTIDADLLVASGYLVSDTPRIERFRHVRRLPGERFAADLYARQ